VPKHVAPPLLSAVLIPHHSAVTSHPHTNHENDLQSDIDTDRVMVDIDTSNLITNPNLNDFQIKMNSVFNTISEWFMVNLLSLNLNMVQKFFEYTSIQFVL
jgi:hypothetical protein